MTLRDLIPWHTEKRRAELSPLSNFQREINSLFDDFFGKDLGVARLWDKTSTFSPKVDVSETEKEIQVRAELPGLEEKDIQLSLTKDYLVLKGEKKSETKKEEGKAVYMESSYGSFERLIPLTLEIEEDEVQASFSKGILTIVLPKSKTSRPDVKKISINSK